MVDLRMKSRVMAGDIPQLKMSDRQAQNLDFIANSTSRDAAILQEKSEKLYLTGFESNARKTINEITERNQSDPENLKKELTEAYKGLSKNAPAHLKDAMAAQFEIMERPAVNNAVKMRTRIVNDQLKETSLQNINEAFKTLESNAAAMLSDDDHVSYDASRSVQLQMVSIQNQLNSLTEEGLPLFGAEQRVKYLENAKQTLVQSGLKGWYDQSSNKIQSYKDFIEGKKKFKLYDASGAMDVEIDPMFEMNRGAYEHVRNYMERDVKRILSDSQKAQGMNDFKNLLLDDTLLIDPKDKDQRAMVNEYFDGEIIPTLENLNPEEKNNAIINYMDRVGIIPNKVNGMIRATLRNGGIEQQVMAADLISKMQDSVPQALSELDGKDVSYGLMLTKNIRAGLTAQEAVTQTKANFAPENKDTIDRLKKDFNDLDVDAAKDIKDLFPARYFKTFGISITDLPVEPFQSEQMKTDYLSLYESQYVLTADEEIAKQRAEQIIKRNWGLTTLASTPRVTKYPPENYYAIEGIDNKWMEKQLVSEIKSETKQDLTKDDIALIPDTETARQVSNNELPTYVVMVRDENGVFNPLVRDRKIMKFKFDQKPVVEEHNQNIVKMQNEKITDMKRLRSSELERMNRVLSGIVLPGEKL